MLQREVHLRHYIRIARKHDFVIIISFLLVFGTALIVSFYIPKSYEASTLILVKSSSGSQGSSTNIFRNILSVRIEQGEMETIKRRFTTDSLLERTIDELESQNIDGLKYLPSIGKLKKLVHTEIVPETRYIKVSVRLEEDEGGERNAAILANELVEQIREVRSNEKINRSKYRKKKLEEKLSEFRKEISEEESNMLSFMKKNGIPTIWQAEFSKILEKRSELIEQKQQIEESQVIAELELKKIEQELKKFPSEFIEVSETISDNPIWIEQFNNLEELKFKIAELKAQVGEDSSELVALEAEKQARKERLEELVTNFKTSISKTERHSLYSPVYINLITRKIEIEIRIERANVLLEDNIKRINEINSEFNSLIQKLPENQFRFDKFNKRLETVYDLSKDIYRQVIEAEVAIDEANYEYADVEGSQIKGGIEVVDPAYPKKVPVSPKIKFISAIACIIGLIIGLATSFMFEYFDNTYKTSEQAKDELNLNLLGIIPKRKSEGIIDSSLESSVVENYNILANNIDLFRIKSHDKVIMLTSSIQEEGKSDVIANLGVSMAKANNKVLIVDADLRYGIQHNFFGLSLEPGLTEILSNPSQETVDKIIQKTEIPNLNLLSTGKVLTNPIELLSSNNVNKLVEFLRELYDLVLFDTTSIFPLADASVLASKLDNCILIIDLDKTPKDKIIRAKEKLDKIDIDLLGLICNRVREEEYYI